MNIQLNGTTSKNEQTTYASAAKLWHRWLPTALSNPGVLIDGFKITTHPYDLSAQQYNNCFNPRIDN